MDREFRFLIGSVSRAINLQRHAPLAFLDEGKRRGLPLAQHLLSLYRALERHVEQRRIDFGTLPDDIARSGAITEMRELVASVRKLQSNLAWIDAAAQPPLDLGTTYFVESAARRLVRNDAEVVVVAAHDIAYATTTDPYRRAITQWGDPSEQGPQGVLVVFVPRREQHSGLLHPLIVHELAHAATDEHGLVTRMLEVAAKRKRIQSRFGKAVTTYASKNNVSTRTAARKIHFRLQYWLEEALCDAIAAQYLGPTYLYSFLSEVVAGNMDEPGRKHPPPRQRVALLLEQLDALGWKNVMRHGAPVLDGWVRNVPTARPGWGPPDDFLVYALDALAPQLRRVVARRVGINTFVPDQTVLKAIAVLLKRGIPPAQLAGGQAAPRPAIILGSWLLALDQAGGDLEALTTAPDTPALASLLPKGLEMAALVEAWE